MNKKKKGQLYLPGFPSKPANDNEGTPIEIVLARALIEVGVEFDEQVPFREFGKLISQPDFVIWPAFMAIYADSRYHLTPARTMVDHRVSTGMQRRGWFVHRVFSDLILRNAYAEALAIKTLANELIRRRQAA